MAWVWVSRIVCLILGIFIGMLITVKHYEDNLEN